MSTYLRFDSNLILRDDASGHGDIMNLDRLEVTLFDKPTSIDRQGMQALVNMVLDDNSDQIRNMTIMTNTMTVNGHHEFLAQILEVLEDIPNWLETAPDSKLVEKFLMDEGLWTTWLRELTKRIKILDLLKYKPQAAPWGRDDRAIV